MPVDARPEPIDRPVMAGAIRYSHEYRDALGRPLRGTVTLTGMTRAVVGGTVIVPAPVVVDLVDGVLTVDLPPDTYQVTAALRTVEGARVADTAAITVA